MTTTRRSRILDRRKKRCAANNKVSDFERVRARSERIQNPRMIDVEARNIERGSRSLRGSKGFSNVTEDVELSPISRSKSRMGESSASFDIMTPKTFVSRLGSE